MDVKLIVPGPRGKPPLKVYDDTHIVFYDASWNFYEAFLAEYDGAPAHVNYDRGTLEIMTLSIEHERYRKTIGEMVADSFKYFGIIYEPGGSTTLKVQPKQRGLESDDCYWIQRESAVRDIDRLDLSIHPPPDLVVEVDVTHATVDRESIYAAMGVPEMWHFDTQTFLTAWELAGGTWNRIEYSKALPKFRPSEMNPFLQRRRTDGHSKVMLDFTKWLHTLPR